MHVLHGACNQGVWRSYRGEVGDWFGEPQGTATQGTGVRSERTPRCGWSFTPRSGLDDWGGDASWRVFVCVLVI